MGTRAERRDTTEAAILAAGLKLLAEGGPKALTVRGVARELSLVPSALYRYVRNRDDLITVLIAHAFNDLADAVESAMDAVPPGDLRGRWRAFAHSQRAWMHANPHAWILAQGMPIPDYEPSFERFYGPATRIHLLLIRLGADAEAAGLARWHSAAPGVLPGLAAMLACAGVEIAEETALSGLAGWHLLAGVLYAERFRQPGWEELIDADRYYDEMVEATVRMIFGPEPG